MKESGQVILILILVMTVALAIGLSIVQRSLVDVSTASKVEQSSRAFSAAEAGIEKALNVNPSENASCADANCPNFADNSSSVKMIEDSSLKPTTPSSGRQAALEFPSLAKEDVAQVWLANFSSSTNPPPEFYNPQPPDRSLDVYWGNPLTSSTDQAALELTLVYYDGNKYASKKWYLDQKIRDNNFEVIGCSGNNIPDGGGATYQCKKTLVSLPPSPNILMLARARLLYNTTSQPLAVQAVGTCATCYLPPQARSITSTGVAGETQRKVTVFQLNKVVPPYFDYAIFSAGDILK